MSAQLSRPRRITVAFVALAFSAVLFRAQIADALVLRGDDYLYRGDARNALERYRRALEISPSSAAAADRFVFVSLQVHASSALHAAVAAAGRYLVAHPDDSAVLSDRALCYLRLHRYAAAERDFLQAGRAAHAATYYVFAGWAAERAGRTARAKALWRTALAVDPAYRPARIALEEQRP